MKAYPLSYGAALLALSKGARFEICIQMVLAFGDQNPPPEFSLSDETVVLTLFTNCSHSVDMLLTDPRLLSFRPFFEDFRTYSQ